MSVRMGTLTSSRTRASAASPALRPGPRYDLSDVRFALSKEALKMYGTPTRFAMAAISRAMPTTWSALSITHGPAIRTRSGRPRITPSVMRTSGTSGDTGKGTADNLTIEGAFLRASACRHQAAGGHQWVSDFQDFARSAR